MILLVAGCGTAESTNQSGDSTDAQQEARHVSAAKATMVQEEVFLNLLNNYNNMFEKIKSDVDYSQFNEEYVGYKFQTINTKEELYKQFTGIMTADMAEKVWEPVVKEGKGNLYLVPMDLYPQFNKNNGYSIEKVDASTYKLTHHHKSELHGIFDMVFHFEKLDDSWKITDLTYNK